MFRDDNPSRNPSPPTVNPLPNQDGIVICRGGLEQVVADELRALDIEVTAIRKRAIDIATDLGGFYRANMGLRSALNVLKPIRSFNARNYDMLYYQSRKTNWHKLFPVDARLRIDVKGGSHKLTHTRYVIHRVKDGITDTFRKLCGGVRPSIDQRDPDLHIVVYLDADKTALAIDTSGIPLFKRGYRIEHGEAPIKEDLAAGLLSLSGWDRRSSLIDPMCGSGTLLFEAWMMAANIAPNLHRRFGFEMLYDYDPEWHEREKQQLISRQATVPADLRICGLEIDAPTFRTMEGIRQKCFPEAPIQVTNADFTTFDPGPGFQAAVCNPPYGIRIGEAEEIGPLYRELGAFLSRHLAHARAGIYTVNHEAAPLFGGDFNSALPILNGSLEGRLYRFSPTEMSSKRDR
jgi:putative N6-adenine-specific DNA methylase